MVWSPPLAGFSLEIKKISYVGAEGCKIFDNPVDVMQEAKNTVALFFSVLPLPWFLVCLSTVPTLKMAFSPTWRWQDDAIKQHWKSGGAGGDHRGTHSMQVPDEKDFIIPAEQEEALAQFPGWERQVSASSSLVGLGVCVGSSSHRVCVRRVCREAFTSSKVMAQPVIAL